MLISKLSTTYNEVIINACDFFSSLGIQTLQEGRGRLSRTPPVVGRLLPVPFAFAGRRDGPRRRGLAADADGPVEQSTRLGAHPVELGAGPTGALPEHRHQVGVAAEGLDVVPHPA